MRLRVHWNALLGRLWLLEARLRGVSLGSNITCLGRPIVSVHPESRLSLGDGIHLHSLPRSNPMGCFQPCVIRTIAEDAKLAISEDVGLSGVAVVCASEIIIGPRTLVGSGAVIIDNDFHDRLPSGAWGNDAKRTAQPIQIGSDVFIGARAMVLKGVSIGDRAIVGAGAIVTRNVPPGHLAVGNPARVIQK